MLLNHKASSGPAPQRGNRPPIYVRMLVMLCGVLISALAGCSTDATESTASHPAAAVGTVASKSPATGITPLGTAAPSTTRVGAPSARAATPSNSSAPAQAQGMTLKFDATFPGTQLNTRAWATCYPWASGGCTNFGNTHDPELEWYQAPQDQISGGALHLIAQRMPTKGLDKQGAAKEYACRSGMVTTYPSLRFEYGFVQVTAKIPFGKGLWPGLWLAAASQKWPPEIDLLEHWGSKTTGSVYLHPLTGARQGGPVSMPGLATGWHTFGLSWTKTRLTWYYDGARVLTTSVGVPHQEMYFIANLADDDTSPGSCSGSLTIKSVQVWE